MKSLLKELYRKFTLWIGTLFFDKQYFQNLYFQDMLIGTKWIWRSIRWQVIGNYNSQVSWPVSQFNTIIGPKENIVFSPNNIDNFQGKGVYFQCEKAKIFIGEGTLIANNVGIITANHDPYNLETHLTGKPVVIGRNCWIGINAVILPGVILGERTVVGAGSVVTHSFLEGNCVIAGNPARQIKKL